jgi:hypothetical protein
VTHDSYLDDRQNSVKWGIVQRVIDAGYEPHMFFTAVPPAFAATVNREIPWTADKVKETIRGAIGAVMVGDPRWKYGDDAHASEFTHYEAGVAHSMGLPMFTVLEQGIRWRGAFDQSSAQICEVPRDADPSGCRVRISSNASVHGALRSMHATTCSSATRAKHKEQRRTSSE